MASKSTYRYVERNIYIDQRSGAFRFRVCVYPFDPSGRTFDSFAEGYAWATDERNRLREDKRLTREGGKASASEKPRPEACGASDRRAALGEAARPVVGPERPLVCARPLDADVGIDPGAYRVYDILSSYEKAEAQKLACPSETTSRLRRLRTWFGHYSLGELTGEIIDRWMERRLAGELGAGRGSRRETSGAGPVPTKDQRRRAREAGRPVPALSCAAPAPVSSQTVRHELGYLRRAVVAFFDREKIAAKHALWLASHPLMLTALPEQAVPRDRRLTDQELGAVLKTTSSRVAPYAILFAIATTLRRAEVCRLAWEDVDFARSVIRVRRPAGVTASVSAKRRLKGRRQPSRRENKTHERSVPLTPVAIKLLEKWGIKKTGRIFPLAPSSLSQAWRRAADRAGLADARLHDCRREGVSRLIDELDLPLEKVMLFTGHKDPAVLAKHYLRPSAERLAAEIGRSGRQDQRSLEMLDRAGTGSLSARNWASVAWFIIAAALYW